MNGLLLVSFFAGALTVVAPCILPLLPVIVGGAVAGRSSVWRVFVIVLSLVTSVFIFTLLLKASTALIAIPAVFWQVLSGGLVLVFGIVTIFPALWDRVPGVSALYVGSNKMLGSGYRRKNVWGDVIMGAALGPVFSSCSPTYFVILAAVLPEHVATGLLYLFAYCAGLGLFLFLVALAGQRAALWLGVAADSGGWFKKILGLVFVLVGVAILFGWDKQLEAALPAGAFGEIGVEQQLLATNQAGQEGAASSSPMAQATSPMFLTLAQKALRYPKEPELVGIAGYINTDGQPINLAQYVGKDVVLVDFWDYSCINCQRTLPYVNAWYQKYNGQGLVIIGVHTPEFAFEQQLSNVQDAVARFGIQYPVVLDNQYKTWATFQNEYWPREYLVDIDGYIVHDHAGEGEYDQTEMAIQQALAERAARLNAPMPATTTVSISPANLSDVGSPETYFGSNRNEYLGNGAPGVAGTRDFTLPAASKLYLNTLYLGGSWDIGPEFAEGGPGDTIEYQYNAHDVYMVATNPNAPVTLKILRDGVPATSVAGADVDPKTGEVTISGDRLYTLVHDTAPGTHTIEIQIIKGTLDAYTFTFG